MMSISAISSNTCVVTLIKYCSVQTNQLISLSGVVINPELGIVLTHGSLLVDLDIEEHEQLQQSLLPGGKSPKQYVTTLSESYGASVIIDVRRKQKQSYIHDHNDSNTIDSQIHQTVPATIEEIIRCESFHETLKKYMPESRGWSFPLQIQYLLPYFVIIKLQDWGKRLYIKPLYIKPAAQCHIGDVIEVFGTPYGDLSPEVFLNSISRGVISNYFGQDNVHLLTDARCVSGTPGGILCSVESDGKRRAVGMVVSPFCWKDRYWVGLTLACSLVEILHCITTRTTSSTTISETSKNLLKTLSTSPSSSKLSSFLPKNLSNKQNIYDAAIIEKAMRNVCRVIGKFGNGTGIVFSPDTIVTCRHVVCQDTEVSVKLHGDGKWQKAIVVYRTPSDDPLDIAVITLKYHRTDSSKSILSPEMSPAAEGMPVYSIGFALFSSVMDAKPVVTSGVVARIVQHKHTQILLQTTCALYPGTSGGLIVNSSGQAVGMSRSNVVMFNDNPHVSLSIPMVTLQPVIEAYLKTKNATFLNKLWIQDSTIKRLWQLQPSVDHKPALSKL